jgi:hypothetical protein
LGRRGVVGVYGGGSISGRCGGGSSRVRVAKMTSISYKGRGALSLSSLGTGADCGRRARRRGRSRGRSVGVRVGMISSRSYSGRGARSGTGAQCGSCMGRAEADHNACTQGRSYLGRLNCTSLDFLTPISYIPPYWVLSRITPTGSSSPTPGIVWARSDRRRIPRCGRRGGRVSDTSPGLRVLSDIVYPKFSITAARNKSENTLGVRPRRHARA